MNCGTNDVLKTPYKGLIPYSEEDARFFFGRENCQKIVTNNLKVSRLTVLYGESAVGKSSVLQAGVVYHLRRLAEQNLQELGTPKFAVVVFNAWHEENLLPKLLKCVQDSVLEAVKGDHVENEDKSLPTRFTQTLQALTEVISKEQYRGKLFIILDQFEEYFLYHSQEKGEGTFAVEFPRAVNCPDLRVNFLICIREDSLAKLKSFQGKILSLFDSLLEIKHLDYKSAREAIVKPVEEYNRQRSQSIKIEQELVDEVLAKVKTGQVGLVETGSSKLVTLPETKIETPYLQLVMTRLWQEEMDKSSQWLRLDTLKQLGGAQTIVSEHLNKQMNRLSDNEKDAAARIFHYLVTPSGQKIAHSVDDLVEAANEDRNESDPELPYEEGESLLRQLSEGPSRILRPIGASTDKPQIERYEVFHDILASAILDWRKEYLERKKYLQEEKRREEKRREKEAKQRALLEQEREKRRRAEQAEKILAEAHRKAKRRILIGNAVLIPCLVLASIATIISFRLSRLVQFETNKLQQAQTDIHHIWEIGQGVFEKELGNNEKALKIFDRVIESNNKNVFALIGRGRTYHQMRRYQEALDDFNHVVELSPLERELTFALVSRGETYGQMKRYQEALDDFNRAIEVSLLPYADAYFGRGNIYYYQGNYIAALENYQQALDNNETHWPAIFKIGLIKYEQGFIDEAIKQWQQAIKINPDSADPKLALGVAFYTKGEQEKAFTTAETSLKLNKQLENLEYLKRNFWGKGLLADAKKLLSTTIIQAFLFSLSPPPSLQEKAFEIVKKWYAAKPRIFAPPFDESLVDQYTTGKLHYNTTRNNGGGSMGWLRSNDCYYEYDFSKIEGVVSFDNSGTRPSLKVKVHEKLQLHGPNKAGCDNPPSSYRKNVTYWFEKDNGVWKIYDYKLES